MTRPRPWLAVMAAVAAMAALLPAEARATPPISTDVDTYFYTDTDNVIVISPQAAVRATLDDEGSEISARGSVDIVTAASVDVVTEATARFTEVRKEANLSGAWALGEWRPSLHYRFSSEPDYLSNGGGLGVQRRLGHDTTLELGEDLTIDKVMRSGTPTDVFSARLVTSSTDVSLTQVLDPQTVVRFAYTFTAQSGYMEKPYRYVPLFDDAGVAAAAAQGVTLDAESFGRFRLAERPAEEVPDRRLRHAWALRALRYVPSLDASLRADYRLYLDDWGIVSHTGELAVRKAWGTRELALSERVYWQSSADFWRRTYVVEAGTVPVYRTVDKALSSFLTHTVELGYTSRHDTWSWYVTAGAMFTRFNDYMFLDSRTAILTEAGLRWTL